MVRFKKDGIEWCLVERGIVSALDFDPLVEGRRHYWVREYGSGKLFIKRFNEKGAVGRLRNLIRPRGKVEYAVANQLKTLSIPTPRPLGFGKGRSCSLSIQEWVDGEDFLTVFNRSTDRLPLLRDLSSALLSLKEGRVLHNDLHTRNILTSRDASYLIDLHKSRIKHRFGRADELQNMCHALSSIYSDMTEEEKASFFRLYGVDHIRPLAEKALSRLRTGWVERKKKRAFNSTSLLEAERDEVRLRQAADKGHGHFVSNLKQDKKTRVDRFSDHIRKTYKNTRRLKKAWRNHITLEYMDLCLVPKPFYVRKAGWGRRGFVAMEDLGPQGDLLSRFLDRNYDGMDRHAMLLFIGRLSSFFIFLLRHGIAHRDTKTSNLFVLHDGALRLLDVEDILFESPVSNARLTAMLVQLNKSLPKRVTIEYRLRFLSTVAKAISLTREARKKLLNVVRKESLEDVILYDGLSGPVIESWD
jgi:tRNA A-37 threonylcarbamoyl transferase component Bud32